MFWGYLTRGTIASGIMKLGDEISHVFCNTFSVTGYHKLWFQAHEYALNMNVLFKVFTPISHQKKYKTEEIIRLKISDNLKLEDEILRSKPN